MFTTGTHSLALLIITFLPSGRKPLVWPRKRLVWTQTWFQYYVHELWRHEEGKMRKPYFLSNFLYTSSLIPSQSYLQQFLNPSSFPMSPPYPPPGLLTSLSRVIFRWYLLHCSSLGWKHILPDISLLSSSVGSLLDMIPNVLPLSHWLNLLSTLFSLYSHLFWSLLVLPPV